MKTDLLRMDYINSLPQPFIARFYGGGEWPIYDIEVETGLLRIDVCGKLQVTHIGDVKSFRDENGVEHDSDSFYSDYEEETTDAVSATPSPSAPPKTEGGELSAPLVESGTFVIKVPSTRFAWILEYVPKNSPVSYYWGVCDWRERVTPNVHKALKYDTKEEAEKAMVVIKELGISAPWRVVEHGFCDSLPNPPVAPK